MRGERRYRKIWSLALAVLAVLVVIGLVIRSDAQSKEAAVANAVPALPGPGSADAALPRPLWPKVQKLYTYVKDQGLLVAAEFGHPTSAGGSTKPELLGAYVVGAGDNPAQAWALSKGGPNRSGYTLSKDDSWFLWITPSRRGLPAEPPTYDVARTSGLLNKKVSYTSVVEDGIAIRSRILADGALTELIWLTAIEKLAQAAELEEKTANRGTARKLRQSANGRPSETSGYK